MVGRDVPFVAGLWPLGSSGRWAGRSHQTPRSMPELYEHERGVAARRGTVLLYSHATWHRATAVELGRLRRTVGLVFRSVGARETQTQTHAHT